MAPYLVTFKATRQKTNLFEVSYLSIMEPTRAFKGKSPIGPEAPWA